ncbi:MAG: MmcQ/YjbR family DNA-binding protein [Clostridium sp.]|nr:MmcQ/YjbR family DNA-binding protein [Clostridium sp.]
MKKKYKAEPEFLWKRFPDYAVFRHQDNRKWFAIIMDVPAEKLGLPASYGSGPAVTETYGGGKAGEESGSGDSFIAELGLSGMIRNVSSRVDVLNIKLDDLFLRDILLQKEGILPGYHLSRGNWISILLDGTVALPEILDLIDISFRTTASKKQRDKVRPPKDWLIPANPKYYDVIEAFRHEKEIRWKQGAGIRTGDTVFMYVAAPVSAILYRCKVTQTDISYRGRNKDVNIKTLMMIRLEKCYDPQEFTFRRLKEEFNIFAVRGPRSVPNSLLAALA